MAIKEKVVISRRGFIKLGTVSVAGMILGVNLPACTSSDENTDASPGSFSPNVWLAVENSGLVTVFLTKSEMGQGVMTALPMLIAEELEVDMASVRVKMATSHSRFGSQYTGGSHSIRENWLILRKAGAAGRMMLIASAAEKWGVLPGACYAERGAVLNQQTGQSLSYSELAASAVEQLVPDEVPLKDAADFKVIGHKVQRLDIPDKVSGRARFGMDVILPDMLVATIAHSPVFGGKAKSFNARKALSVKGVRHVLEIDSGVVVVGEGYWPVMKGLQNLQIQWQPGEYTETSTESMFEEYAGLAEAPGEVVFERGTDSAADEGYFRVIEAAYRLPYQHHATMETMNCTAYVHGSGCEIWAPTQHPEGARNAAAEYVYGGLRRMLEKVISRFTGNIYPDIIVHKTYLGCGFGRRLKHDFIEEAVQISKKLGVPIKLIWSREEDMQHGHYRPGTYNKLHAVLNDHGVPVKWVHRVVGPVQGLSVDGAADIPYSIPYLRVESTVLRSGIPIGPWRSTGGSLNAFVIESFIDEVATEAGVDTYEFRKSLLQEKKEHKAVLEAVAMSARWGSVMPEGHYQGLALYEARNSIVAQVAEVSVSTGGDIKVHKVVCAIDCGMVVNHEIVKSQLESGIIFGLGATIKHEITFSGGSVVESNFDDFPLIRIDEAPEVEVVIVTSERPPGGVGEVAVPPVAPAVANAIFAATGKRMRKLPILPQDIAG